MPNESREPVQLFAIPVSLKEPYSVALWLSSEHSWYRELVSVAESVADL